MTADLALNADQRARYVREQERRGGPETSVAAVRRFLDRWRALGRGDALLHVDLGNGRGQALTGDNLDRLILAATTPDQPALRTESATERDDGGEYVAGVHDLKTALIMSLGDSGVMLSDEILDRVVERTTRALGRRWDSLLRAVLPVADRAPATDGGAS